MSEKINFDYKKLHPFKWFILENYPFLEDSIDALTNYELFCKLGDEINKNRDSINELGLNAEALTEGYNSLVDYVDNYFDNLDVQDEINNKLDSLVENGTLQTLIGAYIQPKIDQQNAEINNFKVQTNSQINSQNQQISNIQASTTASLNEMNSKIDLATSGSPLVASSVSEMTNTSRIYVNTSDGKWYYYNGSAWTIGGTYQATSLSDGSVTFSMLANDVIFDLNTRINNKDKYEINGSAPINLAGNLLNNSINSDGSIGTESTVRVCSNYLYYIPEDANIVVTNVSSGYKAEVYLFDENRSNYLYLEVTRDNIGLVPFIIFRKGYRYARFRFHKSDDSAISTSDVLNNISLEFQPMFYKTDYIIGENKLNPNKSFFGHLVTQNYPYHINQDSPNYHTSYPIPIESGKTYFITRFRQFALYDTNMVFITNSFINANTTNYTFTAAADGYLMISYAEDYLPTLIVKEGTTGGYTPYVEKLPANVQLQNASNLSDIINTANVLFGKKYVALGDSFTHGDFTDSPTQDYIYDSGVYQGQNKVYPYMIGIRNSMQVVNKAVNGMTITNINGESENYLDNTILESIPSDADYITIKIGINDDTSHQSAPIGDINDNVSTTFYGSWNRVMNYLINNHKNAKIGIIVSNGITNVDYINATIAIAKKYGVSYINEANDDRVPLLIRTLRSDVNSTIKTLRDNEWEVLPGTNGHPNVKCHEYESTIIENFLRTL